MKILLVEDDDSINRGVVFALEKEGYRVNGCKSIRSARQSFTKEKPDLIICDINLPDGDGLSFVTYAREHSNAYIICLTALAQEMEQVMGYGAGADDYITKPFSLSVLLLKIQAYAARKTGNGKQKLISGEIELLVEGMKVFVRGKEISFTKNEWKLLKLFLENPKQILSKKQILEQLFDIDGNFVEDNTVAVNINRLREKIEKDKSDPKYIKNVRGLGYLWNQEVSR